MKISDDIKLDFDDVLIRPKPSELKSRSEVNLEVSYITKHSRKRFTGIPVCAANMDTIGQLKIARILSEHKIWTALHKFISSKEIIDFLKESSSNYSFVTMGISDSEILRMTLLNPKAICIDAANAYMYHFLDVVKRVRENHPDSIIMAGNVCTPEGVENIIKAGADIAKAGIANGNFCLTKNMSGIGYKQFSVAMECGQAANELNALCCSDGGCKEVGDICKALGSGSHMVMCGSLFSGVDEAENLKSREKNGSIEYLIYGMSSEEANEKYFGGLKNYRASEGAELWVKSKGSINDIARNIKGGLASCCTYTNTKNLENLNKNCTFTK